jgi:hypothetical protein
MVSIALPAALLSACSAEVAGPGPMREPGVLVISGWAGDLPLHFGTGEGLYWTRPHDSGDYTAPQPLVAPDTVAAGATFEVRTHTVGPNGCWRSDGQTVASYGRVVVLKPYDSHSGSEVCTEQLAVLSHASTLVLDEPGEWTLRVDGRRLRLGDEAGTSRSRPGRR